MAAPMTNSSAPVHRSPHVVVVGGGISGLSAAFYLQQAARRAGLALHTTLIERDAHFGGKIRTETIPHPAEVAGAGFVIEAGPDSFLTQKPWGVELVRELGLGDQLMGTNAAHNKVYVLVGGKPRPLPEGMQLVVPTRLMPFVRSPVLSPWGKLRMALDLFIPPRRDDADETLADCIRRRLGAEALDRIAEPLMAGIYNAEPERQSLLATFPYFRALEQGYGSLIRGMRAQRRTRNHEPRTVEPTAGSRPSVPGSSTFVTLRGGVGTFVDALVAALGEQAVNGRGVAAIDYVPALPQPYRVRLDDGTTLAADAVILTTPAFAAADLVAPFQPALAAGLRQIRYVTTGTVSLAYRRAAIGDPLDGFGLVIPRSERRQINACTMSSLKFDHRAPAEHTLLRVFVGGSRTPDVIALDDDALLEVVRNELRAILGIAAAPLFTRIYRWPRANPQYDLGHLERVAALEALCPPGLYLAGSAYRGVGIPDCVRQGKEAAAHALAYLQRQELEYAGSERGAQRIAI